MSSLDLNPELPATTRTSGSRETLEDYTLRYAPRSFRRWGPGVVAVTALVLEARDLGKKGRDKIYGHGLICGSCGGR